MHLSLPDPNNTKVLVCWDSQVVLEVVQRGCKLEVASSLYSFKGYLRITNPQNLQPDPETTITFS